LVAREGLLSHSIADTPVERVLLEWQVHLLARRPQRLLLVFGSSLLASLAASLLWSHWAYGILGAALVIVSAGDYLFPLRYRITTRGASVRSPFSHRSIAWRAVRHVYQDQAGVKLSPLPRRSRLENLVGVYLRFAEEAGAPGQAQEVIDAVREARASAPATGGRA
jgi:hypothetical protein